MKTKTLEKLENFQLQNKKLDVILGGQGAPVKSFANIGSPTGGGERCVGLGPNGEYQCVAYSSDTQFGDGSYMFVGEVQINRSC
ncbi:hypothetical protein [Chryseobacterium sp. SIMBA_029]|uniref:hypothetical protein n=1 Tax=Chryseobacterium sp. SIMBA_029 TaxID=3085772 RepID=UPI00397BEC02